MFFCAVANTSFWALWKLDSQCLPKPMQSAREQTSACLSQWKIPDVCCSLAAKSMTREAINCDGPSTMVP